MRREGTNRTAIRHNAARRTRGNSETMVVDRLAILTSGERMLLGRLRHPVWLYDCEDKRVSWLNGRRAGHGRGCAR